MLARLRSDISFRGLREAGGFKALCAIIDHSELRNLSVRQALRQLRGFVQFLDVSKLFANASVKTCLLVRP